MNTDYKQISFSSNDEIAVVDRPGGAYKAYWDHENKQIVVLDTWYVDGGDGDVMPEFDVVGRFDSLQALNESEFGFQL